MEIVATFKSCLCVASIFQLEQKPLNDDLLDVFSIRLLLLDNCNEGKIFIMLQRWGVTLPRRQRFYTLLVSYWCWKMKGHALLTCHHYAKNVMDHVLTSQTLWETSYFYCSHRHRIRDTSNSIWLVIFIETWAGASVKVVWDNFVPILVEVAWRKLGSNSWLKLQHE